MDEIKLFQINSVLNYGSTGRIAEELGNLAIKKGWKSYIAYGRKSNPSNSVVIKIGNKVGILFHVFLTRFFDIHGFGSYWATKKLIKDINQTNPNIIHLHNIHGYYVNVKILFKYLKRSNIPVIWTLHDCWSFTGHCSHYMAVSCDCWKNGCKKCIQKAQYPKSFFDNSVINYRRKKSLFTGIKNLTIVTPSIWLQKQVKESFLKEYEVYTINNGIDFNYFRIENEKENSFSVIPNDKKIVLGVASVWTERKGLFDFYKLAEKLSSEYIIVLVGVNKKQLSVLPKGIIGIERTGSAKELAKLYEQAFAFFNPTYEDTFPTTNIEALACGTPVITYNSGGSAEIIDDSTGFVVAPGDLDNTIRALKQIKCYGRDKYANSCVQRAHAYYDKEENFKKYFDLYEKILENINNFEEN